MKCSKCDHEATVQYPNGDLCGDCFINMLVSRVKKELRNEQAFKKGERVLVFGKLAMLFLDRVIEDLPIVIVEATEEYNESILERDYPTYDKVVIPWTADDEAQAFYEELTKRNPTFSSIGMDKKIVKLFKTITAKELVQAASIISLSFEPKKRNEELASIQKKYPSATAGFAKSAHEFKKALR